ncbi:hypothetical protein PhCBS80983_g00734 [Powellomyces hirtus]|uniref:Uncharacterized protein n=1 Tax=Powellomyces hirtus TaxID=109895 RepID=A0A507EE00_9FUNG|nr:hypothetical protein PhCBS80983_g00734 [Powellomyces hirtus]
MSSRRSTRKRKAQPATTDVSSSWYVGYAEDGESVEAIMQKFQELDRMQRELATQESACAATPALPAKVEIPDEITPCDDPAGSAEMAQVVADATGDEAAFAVEDRDQAGFTQEQLEELFKRTSGFTVKQAAMNLDPEDLDDMELWRLEMEGLEDDDWAEQDDAQFVDDDFWGDGAGELSSGNRKAVRVARVRSVAGSRNKLDRESLIAKYKVMQIQMQDRHGNYFVMKKRICAVDPTLPTYVRIPPVPIPRAWVKFIAPYSAPNPKLEGCRYHEQDVLTFNLKSLGNRFQAVHMDPPLLLPGEESTPGKISVDQLSKLDIPSIIPCGFLFIWAEKELTPHILRVTHAWGFRYVENFAWIKRERNNRIAQQASRYFNKSKMTCFIFRKEQKTGDVELRHQRSPDCEFDFIKPPRPGQTTEEKPEFIYNVIETLLPQAVYTPTNPKGDRMLDL